MSGMRPFRTMLPCSPNRFGRLPDLRRSDGSQRDEGIDGVLDGGHGLMVADGLEGSTAQFVTLVSLIPCGFADPFVRPKGEC